MAIKRPTEKNTKTEILSAFDELLKEKKSLEVQLAAKPIEPPLLNGNTVSIPEVEVNPVPLNQQKMETIIDGLNQLQLNFGSAISDLSEKLVLEAIKLQEIRTTVTEETEQLASLHNLQANDTDLDDLIQQYEDSAKTYNEEFRLRQEELVQAITQAKKAWAKEQEDYRRTIKERNETLQKTCHRDTKEYTYELNLERKLTNDTYEQERKRLYQELAEFQKTQEKQWAEREQAMSDRETQFADLKAKVEAMPRELETAIKRAKEEGKGIAQHQAKVKADLTAKEIEGQTKTYELRIDFLEETISDQQTRLQSLTKQLDAALKQVQDLAVKAIEGAADISSFDAVREIALEQAKNQNKTK